VTIGTGRSPYSRIRHRRGIQGSTSQRRHRIRQALLYGDVGGKAGRGRRKDRTSHLPIAMF